MGGGKRRVDRQGPRGGRVCQALGLFRRHGPVRGGRVVEGQAIPGQGVVRIDGERLLEVGGAFVDSVGGELGREVVALEVQLIGFGIVGRAALQSPLVFAGPLSLQPPGHRRGNVTLHRQQVDQLAIVLSAPEQRALVDVGEFDADGQRVAATGNATREDGGHVKLVTDLLRRHRLPLVAPGDTERNHLEAGQPGQAVTDAFGDSIGDVLVVRVIVSNLERQDGDRVQRLRSPAAGDGEADGGEDQHDSRGECNDQGPLAAGGCRSRTQGPSEVAAPGKTIGGGLGESAPHRRIDPGSHVRPGGPDAPRRLGHQTGDDDLGRRTGVRRFADQHLVGDRAERVLVRTGVDYPVGGGLFRAHVLRRAE